MITEEKFYEAISEFDKIEKRAGFYYMAVDLINCGFEIEAYFLILATWNIGSFKFAVKEFNINGFKEKIKKLNPYFDKMKNKHFKTINLDEYEKDIKKIFKSLSEIEGIKFTGASKIMHLKNRSVFIMWDDYIRGNRPQKYYKKLKIVNGGCREYKNKYGKDAEGYFQFLKDTQELFRSINFQDSQKTFAKEVDEYNYVNITRPIQKMEKNENEKKRKK